MRFHALLFSGLSCVSSVLSIFADDAYNIDYHRSLLGVPQAETTLFHRPQASSNASLLYTISDKAVLGAVNPRDGSLLWRQALGGQPVENGARACLAATGDGKLLSGYQSDVSAWDAVDGRLVWTTSLKVEVHVQSLELVPRPGQTSQDTDVLVLAGGAPSSSTIMKIDGGTGVALWHFSDDR